jgi:hypothetical protein
MATPMLSSHNLLDAVLLPRSPEANAQPGEVANMASSVMLTTSIGAKIIGA